jgi:hypothetical protein
VAEPAVIGPPVGEADVATGWWRGIDELAGLVGAYSWVENQVFQLSGAWATAPGHAGEPGLEPSLRVWCAEVSRRHGELAVRWAERLPFRADVDRATLVGPPAGPLAGVLEALAAGPDTRVAVAALAGTVLPRLRGVYGAHLLASTPASEGPVLEVLVGAHRDLAGEISRGGSLLQGSAEGRARDRALDAEIERAFEQTSVFPAVPAS